jgi:hypothetical protein
VRRQRAAPLPCHAAGAAAAFPVFALPPQAPDRLPRPQPFKTPLCSRTAQACKRYEAALAIRPKSHQALYNWGVALSDLARALRPSAAAEAAGCLHLASQKYAASLRIAPGNPQALNNWGLVLQVGLVAAAGGSSWRATGKRPRAWSRGSPATRRGRARSCPGRLVAHHHGAQSVPRPPRPPHVAPFHLTPIHTRSSPPTPRIGAAETRSCGTRWPNSDLPSARAPTLTAAATTLGLSSTPLRVRCRASRPSQKVGLGRATWLVAAASPELKGESFIWMGLPRRPSTGRLPLPAVPMYTRMYRFLHRNSAAPRAPPLHPRAPNTHRRASARRARGGGARTLRHRRAVHSARSGDAARQRHLPQVPVRRAPDAATAVPARRRPRRTAATEPRRAGGDLQAGVVCAGPCVAACSVAHGEHAVDC